MNYKEMANKVESRGRYGDSVLVHMNPVEVAGIASLTPGGLTTNPDTGRPEAFAFLLPMLGAMGGGMLGSSLLAGAGSLLGTGALATAIGTGLGAFGGGTLGGLAAGYDFKDALKGGLISGVGGGLFSGLGSAFGNTATTGPAAGEIAAAQAGTGAAPIGASAPLPPTGAANLGAVAAAPLNPLSAAPAAAAPAAAPSALGGWWEGLSTPAKVGVGLGGVGLLGGMMEQGPDFPDPKKYDWVEEQYPTKRKVNRPRDGYDPKIDPEHQWFLYDDDGREHYAPTVLNAQGYAGGGEIGFQNMLKQYMPQLNSMGLGQDALNKLQQGLGNRGGQRVLSRTPVAMAPQAKMARKAYASGGLVPDLMNQMPQQSQMAQPALNNAPPSSGMMPQGQGMGSPVQNNPNYGNSPMAQQAYSMTGGNRMGNPAQGVLPEQASQNALDAIGNRGGGGRRANPAQGILPATANQRAFQAIGNKGGGGNPGAGGSPNIGAPIMNPPPPNPTVVVDPLPPNYDPNSVGDTPYTGVNNDPSIYTTPDGFTIAVDHFPTNYVPNSGGELDYRDSSIYGDPKDRLMVDPLPPDEFRYDKPIVDPLYPGDGTTSSMGSKGGGYAYGGQVMSPTASAGSQSPQVRLIEEAAMALRGEHPTPEPVIQRFVAQFGPEALQHLRARVLAEMNAQGGDAGLVRGPGTGTSDSIPATINGQEEIRLSDGEYVLPKKTVEAVGGPKPLDSLVKSTTGKKPGPKALPIPDREILPRMA